MAVAILAFGSLADEPGDDLRSVIVRRVAVQTPFPVEFARSSRTRHGAPTLVPVTEGGARVPASLLMLDEFVSVREARLLLFRRETRQAAASIAQPADWIAELPDFAGASVSLHAAFPANIPPPLTGERLAGLALASAAAPSGASRQDGISYLNQQRRRGVETPLTRPYEEALLARTGQRRLAEAWMRARSGRFAR
jgi:hypothetical protein